MFALLLVALLGSLPWAGEPSGRLGWATPTRVLIGVWVYAHLAAVFFRAYADPLIFVQHRATFLFVPLALVAGFLLSDWLILIGLSVAGFWAIYHLGMQNFGLARLYDVRAGNSPEVGRQLDYGLTQVVTILPFVAGVTLMPTLQVVRLFERVGWDAPVDFLIAVRPIQAEIAPFALAVGALYLAFYVWSYRRLIKRGYRLCPTKLLLFATTGTTAVLAWGFLPPSKAFFVTNFYHALQYFAFVWWSERGNVTRLFRLGDSQTSRGMALAGFLIPIFAFGILYQAYGLDYRALRWAASIGLAVSLLHYWYDGFIWSVRRNEI